MSPRREYLLYLTVAVLGVLPALAHPGAIVGDGVDAYGSHWFYWWMRACIEHFRDPSFTSLFFYPSGKDVFAHTGLNLVDATLSVPFQWAFGPTLYQPLFVIVLQLGNAVSMRALARDVFGDVLPEPGARRAAIVATLLWMTNPFAFYELTDGRPTQAFLWFVPAAFFYLRRVAREPSARNVVGLGLSVGLAGWSYWFNGYFLALALPALALFELRDAADRRRALLGWAAAAVVCGALVAPAVWAMVAAYRHGAVPGLPTPGGVFDPPTGIGEGGTTVHRGLWLMEKHGAPQLLQPAWGLPLLLVLFARRLKLPRWRWLAVLGVTLTIAIGPYLVSGAHPVLWPPYMVLYRHLPFFDRLWFPYRVLGVAFVPMSLLVAAWAARTRWLPVALVLGSLAGQGVVASWPLNWHAAASPTVLTALRDEGGAVLFLPFKSQHEGLMWQTEFQLPTFGGMGESAPTFWPPDLRARLGNGFVRALRAAVMVPPQPAPFSLAERAAIAKLGFRWIALRMQLFDAEVDRAAKPAVVTPEQRTTARTQAVQRISQATGTAPAGLQADVVLWDMTGGWQAPDGLGYTDEKLAAIPWDGPHESAFTQRNQALGRAAPDVPLAPVPPQMRPNAKGPGGRPGGRRPGGAPPGGGPPPATPPTSPTAPR